MRIECYDPAWPARFEEERAALAGAIGDWAVGGIHHVGSTAVPGLDAKPVIDILVGVRTLNESRSCFDQLARLGYLYAPYRTAEGHGDRKWLISVRKSVRTRASPRGLSPWTVWPAFSTLAERPSRNAAANDDACVSLNASLSAPFTTSTGQVIA